MAVARAGPGIGIPGGRHAPLAARGCCTLPVVADGCTSLTIGLGDDRFEVVEGDAFTFGRSQRTTSASTPPTWGFPGLPGRSRPTRAFGGWSTRAASGRWKWSTT